LFFSLTPFLERKGYSCDLSKKCLPGFPYKDGWYGGDAAYSIRLDEKRTLWLFGDTFVSNEGGRHDRIGMDVVFGTTVAISTCSSNGEFSIRYYLKKTNDTFVSSFGENEWLWPQDPFIVHHTLYIPLLVVEAKPEIEGPFKFRIGGHRLARIKYFMEEDPNSWKIEYMDLTPAIPERVIAFATTSVVYEHYVYYYPLCDSAGDRSKSFGNMIARIPVNRLNDPVNAIEYFTKDGQWEKGLAPAKAKIVLDAGVSELSVRYHTDRDRWIAVYMSTKNRGEKLLYQVADRPEGPWSEPKALIEMIPEVDLQSPRYDPNNFCYAGKEHVEFADERTLLVTYVCNSFEDFQKKENFIRKNLFLYRPIVNHPRY